ncbi:MAG: homoserine kinase [Candidatus Nanopelagicales bacterium]
MPPLFRDLSVRLHVPATSANLGPGFDAFGLALSLADDLVAEVTSDGLEVEVDGEGADQVPRDEGHLVVRAMRAAFDLLGGQPPGLLLRCVNRIPHGRGLGSSAAAIVGGIVAARALTIGGDERLPDDDVLALAASVEGHPDNVAACWCGGFTIAWTSNGRAACTRLDVDQRVRPVVFIPSTGVPTSTARGLLPATVPHADAASNAGRAALLVAALTKDPALLLTATEDRLHQIYRSSAMPASFDLVESLRASGVPAVISGAGPTVLAFDIGNSELVSRAPVGFSAYAVEVDAEGCREC